MFLTAQWLLRRMGAPRALPESSITICIGERELARSLSMFVQPLTVPLH